MRNKSTMRKENKSDVAAKITTGNARFDGNVFIFYGPMTMGQLATELGKPASYIVTHFFKQGKMLAINSILDEEQIAEVVLEAGFEFRKEEKVEAYDVMNAVTIKDDAASLVVRPPVVTIMGHVNHGKTTLIDCIFKMNVQAREVGGITQHVGAYQINYNGNPITFLDTPGHEAFAEMRARGANLTDIVVLVVAADDGVMPQTIEAIKHAKAAKVPIVVFVNKMDKPGANLEKLKGELAAAEVTSEEWGGQNQFVYGSALKNEGIDKLFAAILVEAEMLELKVNPNRLPVGVVVESRLDRGRGAIATLIIEHGTIYPRDFMVAGSRYGRIRTLADPLGAAIISAGPGTPVVVTGLNYAPAPGDRFFGFRDEKFAKKLASEREAFERQQDLQIRPQFKESSGRKALNIIIKADTHGSAEALKQSVENLGNDEARVFVVRTGIGDISLADASTAKTAQAVIFAFNVNIRSEVKLVLDEYKIKIYQRRIIYEAVKDVEGLLKRMQAPKFAEKPLGAAQVLKTFFFSKVGQIIGAIVTDGTVKSGSFVRIIRNDKEIHNGKLESLQQGKQSIKVVEKGKEFGCRITDFTDAQEFDILKFYELVEVE